ncbi:hypothetical protein F5Y18DRAFT_408790 [Xylariaceae sp. FL1019]|nr:hypothetical protein F5Y18DRAFT_408790 [Xylariaceae sp. FL1019]
MIHECIKNIKHPEKIKKFMCIGLGRLVNYGVKNDSSTNESHFEKPTRVYRYIQNIAQHVMAVKIVEQLEATTGSKIELYGADPMYDKVHEEFLKNLKPKGFTNFFDTSYDRQEHWPYIDDETFVFGSNPGASPIKLLVFEYARPAVMLTAKVTREENVADYPDGPFDKIDEDSQDLPLYPFDAQWIEIRKEPGSSEKIAIPFKEEGRAVEKAMRDYVREEEFKTSPGNVWWSDEEGWIRMQVRKDLTV